MNTHLQRFPSPSPRWRARRPSGPRLIRSDTGTVSLPLSTAPTLLHRPDGRPAPLDGLYRGQHLFLILSGPSLKQIDLSRLGRGTVTLGVNNSWLVHRPTFWTAVDPPESFSDLGWKDPGITKFVPWSARDRRLRFSHPDGTIHSSLFMAREMPSTYFFTRNCGFDPATFFTEDHISWGTTKNFPDALGFTGARSVMLAALRIAHYLGFHDVYLLGCDFHMPIDTAAPAYAWNEGKAPSGRAGNNGSYRILTSRFKALQSHILANNIPFRIWNCNESSGLRVFPFMPFDRAIARATSPFSIPPVTSGWYTQQDPKAMPTPASSPLDAARLEEKKKYDTLYADKSIRYGGTAFWKRLIPHIREHEGPVVDFGCGRNLFLPALADARGPTGVGIDFSSPAADIRAPMHATGLPAAHAGVVTSFDALEHLLPEEVEEVISEMARVAKPGAPLFMTIASIPSRHTVEGRGLHMTLQPPSWWRERFSRVADLLPEGTHHLPPRYILGRFHTAPPPSR